MSWLVVIVLSLTCVVTNVFAQTTPIVIAPTSLPNAIVGFGTYSQTITASGGTGAKTFAVSAGSLPPGLALSSSGVLAGSPTTGGTYNFLVTATDTVSATGSWAYSLVVVGPPVVTSPTATAIGASTAVLGGTVTETGGAVMTARGVVYSLTASNPTPQLGGPGVTAVSTGAGTGAFTVNVTGLAQASVYSFRAYATNSTGTGYSTASTFTTTAISISPTTLPSSLGNLPYAQFFTATGGVAPYTFTVSGGTLPPGLTLSPVGELRGTLAAAGLYTFSITATDAGGASRAQSYAISVSPAVVITTTLLPDHALNVANYFYRIEATGGTGEKTFQVTEGSLPPGLTLDLSGNLTGTPFASGSYTFTVTALDPTGATASQRYTIVIGGPVLITTTTLPNGSVNQSNYNQRIAASGGTGFKTFTVTSGNVPPGLTLGSDGVLNGTPTTVGTFTFTVTASDALGETNARSFVVLINPALTIATTTLPGAPVDLSYNQSITATGGTDPKTFTLTSGTLPSGLSLGADGVIAGSPTTAGTFDFTVTVTDAVGARSSQAYSLVVGGPIGINPATLSNPVINVAGYNASLTSTGGTGARTFTVTSGSLPPGLSLSPAGVLSGTATSAGTFGFTVTATDATGATGARTYTLVVNPPVLVAQSITFATLPDLLATDGPISLTATASSSLPVSYTVTGPATLAGTTLTLTGGLGVVTVTASQPGNNSFLPATSVVRSFTVNPADRLVNLSSRVRIAPDATRSLITGFVIGGTQTKRVLLRAIGPSLAGFGVTGAVANPRLQVFDSAGRLVLENDDWSGIETSTAFTQVGAFALQAGSRDAAVVALLAPGPYTMQITAGTETGVVLAEVYDASSAPGSEIQRLVNISSRGNVDVGDGVLIGGFVISGVTPKRVLIRGIGPGLATFGVGGTLADPNLTVYSGTTMVARNNDWSSPTTIDPLQPVATAGEVSTAALSVGAFALSGGSKDAAVLVTLAPGSYTAQVNGVGTASGVALVEIYEVP